MNLNIKYINGNLSKDFTKKKFDVITCMEVLEHVDDVSITIEKISKLLKKDGLFVGSTINQTIISYITAIFFAENIFKIVPKRTHSWSQFIKPNKLKKHLFEGNFKDIKFQGVFYNLISKKWKLIENQSINYMFSCKAK